MSAAATLARVAQLEALLAGAAQAPATAARPPAAGAEFSTTLSSASATGSAPVAGSAAGGAGDVPYAALIDAAAARHGVDPALLRGLVRQESGFDPQATSPAGARGLTQLMPGTAAALGVTDPTDPAQALDGGAAYLRQMLDRFGDEAKALAAYNAGPGAVARYGGVPPYAETRAYVDRVLAYAASYRNTSGSAMAA